MITIILIALVAIIIIFFSHYISFNVHRYINFNLSIFLLYFILDDKAPIINIFIGNISILDTIFIISLLVFLIRVIDKKEISRTFFITSFIIFLSEVVILIHTLIINGSLSLWEYQSNFGFISQLFVFSTFQLYEEDVKKIFKSLKYYSLLTIILGLTRLVGLLDMPAQVRFSTDWERFRYIVNYQSLYLLLFVFIFITLKNTLRVNKLDFLILSLTVITLVVVPQRMIWVNVIVIILIVFFRYKILLKENKLGIIIILLSTAIILSINLGELSYQLENAFLNPLLHFEESNAGYRVKDYFWTVDELLIRRSFYFGFGINDIPVRYLNNIRTYYPIHSYIFLKMYQGGLFLLLSHIFFNTILIRKFLRYFSKPHVEAFFWVYILTFLYSLTTFGGVFQGFILGISIAICHGAEKKHTDIR